MKAINSSLLLGIFLLVTYSSCEKANTIPQENEKVIEVQTGSDLGEDDIIRIKDIYGRA